ncbi:MULTISPECIES: HEAT repeat domain-containing protein [Actinosynnema]|uniref:HEAT repeat domain-containing protein n=1 Tax=Actinosynnema TaxID=40566 RepID=UPI0020A30A48|nr:HEAT repeat domain-containing protein [Actinosynnema pretiosum]MCP2097727.1 hypothetical protein [Actinosynnema pretiosum]
MTTSATTRTGQLTRALAAEDASVRLRAAVAAGTSPDPALLDVLVGRCAAEPDFFVREALTWALTRLPARLVLPRLRRELTSPLAQARSQALHTLSKVGDPSAWPWITPELLHDPETEVARTAWRAAVVLVPDGERERLAGELLRHLGRGDRDTRLSLSRALVGLGEVVRPLLAAPARHPDPEVAVHAGVTEVLLDDPGAGFDGAWDAVRRTALPGPASPEC